MLRWKVGAEDNRPAWPLPLPLAGASAVLLPLLLAALPDGCWLEVLPFLLLASLLPLLLRLLAAPLAGPTYCMGTSSGRTSAIERAGAAAPFMVPAPGPEGLPLALLLLTKFIVALWLPPLLLLLSWPCRAATFSASSVGASGRMTGRFRSVCPRLATAAGGGSGCRRTPWFMRECAGLNDGEVKRGWSSKEIMSVR